MRRSMMLLAVLTACFASPASAQEPKSAAEQQAFYRAEYKKLKVKPFVAHGGWTLDYTRAREGARASGKLLFTYFTRTYAH